MSHDWYDDEGRARLIPESTDPIGDAAVRRAHHRRELYAAGYHAATERIRHRHLEEFTRILREELLKRGYLPPLPQVAHAGEPVPDDTIDVDAPDPTEPPPLPADVCTGPDCERVLDAFRPYPLFCSDRCMLRGVAASLDDDEEPADEPPTASR